MNEVKALPLDVWLEILRRIPAADLLRLKAVCKNFYALISDDLFVQLHLKHFTKNPKAATKLIINSTYPLTKPYQKTYDPDKRTVSVWYDEPRFHDWCSHDWTDDLDARPIPKIHRHRVIDSYDGLLLVQICDRPLLYNPITRLYKLMPSIRGFSSICFGCWKVAYDVVSEQYKVFCLWECGSLDRVSLYVYDVHKNEEELHYPRETKIGIKSEDGSLIMMGDLNLIKDSILVNGNVYWVITTYEDDLSQWTCIVSANVTNEEVKTRSCSFTPVLDPGSVFAANGMFYQFGLPVNNDEYYSQHQLWVLEGVECENPNPSWRMKHRIDTSRSPIRNNLYAQHLLGMFRDKLLMMVTGRDDNPDQLCQYDLSREEFEQVTVARDGHIGRKIQLYESFSIIEHVDSLISCGRMRKVPKSKLPSWLLKSSILFLLVIALLFLFLLDKML